MTKQTLQRHGPSTPASSRAPSAFAPRGFGDTLSRLPAPTPQAKLTVNQPGDKYEQEADAVADQVLRMGESASVQREDAEEEEEAVQAKPLAGAISPLVQREGEEEDEDEEDRKPVQAKALTGTSSLLQRDPAPEEEDPSQTQASTPAPDAAQGHSEAQTPKVQGQGQDEELQAQRKDTGGPQSADVSGVVSQGLSGGGQPLDDSTRAYMEPRFGHDFSQVRIHTDSRASQSSEQIAARAYTVGSDIAFRAGEFRPGTGEGKRLLAHELTHVVQQGAVPTAEPLRRFPIKMPLTAQRLTVQCYQAGDTGHGGIEQAGLISAGFKPDAASQSYFGNWLRDLSQIPPKALPVVSILAQGEFGRTVTQEDLGTYVPSEHLDNPEGGGTVEDPRIQALESSTDPEKRATFEAALAKLSPDQKAAYDKEQENRHQIEEAARTSGLPVYIERGKLHAKEKLAETVRLGNNPAGLMQMGNALHAVEDYFSHSNFVEAAIWTLYRSGAPVGHLVDRMANTALGANAALAGGLDEKGQPKIVTGTYKPGGNDWVSRLELLQTEIEHGQLTKAFIVGLLRQGGIGLEELGQRLGKRAVDSSGLDVAGGVMGGVLGAVGGAVVGAKQGTDDGILGEIAGGIIGAARGGIRGYRAGKQEAEQIGEGVGGGAGHLLDIMATSSLVEIASLLRGMEIAIDISPLHYLVDAIIEARVKSNTDQSAQEAPADSKTGVVGPTHSQIAKDAPDSPLFGVSATLAQEVVKDIGTAMNKVWSPSKPGDAPSDPKAASPDPKPVTDLVDKYVSTPSGGDWWQRIVLAAATKK